MRPAGSKVLPFQGVLGSSLTRKTITEFGLGVEGTLKTFFKVFLTFNLIPAPKREGERSGCPHDLRAC